MRAARARLPLQPGPGDKQHPPVICLKPQCLVARNVCSCLVSPLPEAPGPGVLGHLPQGPAGCSLKALGCPPTFRGHSCSCVPWSAPPPTPRGCPDPQPRPSVHPACRSAAGLARAPRVLGVCPAGPGWGAGPACLGQGWGGCSVYSQGQMGRNPNPASRSLLPAQTNLASSSSDANSKCERVSCPSRGLEGRQHPAQVLQLRDLTVGPPGREGALRLEPCAAACLPGGGMGRAGHSSLHSQPCSSRLQQAGQKTEVGACSVQLLPPARVRNLLEPCTGAGSSPGPLAWLLPPAFAWLCPPSRSFWPLNILPRSGGRAGSWARGFSIPGNLCPRAGQVPRLRFASELVWSAAWLGADTAPLQPLSLGGSRSLALTCTHTCFSSPVCVPPALTSEHLALGWLHQASTPQHTHTQMLQGQSCDLKARADPWSLRPEGPGVLTQQFSFLGLPRADHYTCTGVDFHARPQSPERLAPSSSCLTCRPLCCPKVGFSVSWSVSACSLTPLSTPGSWL